MRRLHNALILKELYKLKSLGFEYTDFTPSNLEDLRGELPDSIEELRALTKSCQLCELSKSRKRVVFGEGDLSAKILFVGEGPGATEDSTGRPFVGRAGELLTKIIERVLLIPRSSCYIANIVKCRPPNNRVPTQAEAVSCRPYLMKQIEIIAPKIVVTLGGTAYNYLTDEKVAISRVRGSIMQKDNYILVPTFHPSYLLRNPSKKRLVYEDFLKIKELLSQL